MSAHTDPNPPSRKDESFPKTTTLPEGWSGDALMSTYNPPAAIPPQEGEFTASGAMQCSHRPAPQVDEELFNRRLDPFPKPNTIPNGWDLSEMWS